MRQFHLAYYRANVFDLSNSQARNSFVVRLALVPADAPRVAIDLWDLDTLTMSGEPGTRIKATPHDLLSLRRVDTREHTEDRAVEGLIIARLKERAKARGHVLPDIIGTLVMPHWSKMPVPGDILWELRRTLGA